jgi:EmrB/QacA subfamily drug resistance transporter
LLDTAGWRWIFFVNVPIGVVAVILGLRKLHAEPPEDAGPFDVLSLILVATGLAGITYGLAEVGSAGSALTQVTVPLAGGAALVGAFVLRSLHIPRPLLDMRLYANKAFSAASVTTFCLGAALFGGMILMPLYFQTVRHEDALLTGLLLIPRGVGGAVAGWVSGRLTDRLGAGLTAAIGGVTALVFTIPFVMIGPSTPYALICSLMVMQGFGLGLTFTPVMTAAFRALRPSQVNDASPQLNILMRVGGSISTAIFTVVLQQNLTRAGRSPTAQASAFGTTFWWVLGFTAVAVIPTVVLMAIERRQGLGSPEPLEPPLEAVPLVPEME